VSDPKTALSLPPVVALRMQREIILTRRNRLDLILEAIARAEQAISGENDATRWGTLRAIIEVMKMENNDSNWTKNYFSEEAQQKIAERASQIPKKEIETGERAWTQLIAEVEEAARHEDPASEHARGLARRWKALVGEFTGGDKSIGQGLNKLWSDQTHWPKGFGRPWSDEADSFIVSALNHES